MAVKPSASLFNDYKKYTSCINGIHIVYLKTKKVVKKAINKQHKQHTLEVSGGSVQVKYIIRKLKVFKIPGELCCNRRKRLGLRLNLNSSIYT